MTITRPYFTKQRRQLSPQQKRQSARHASVHLHAVQRRLPKQAKIGIYYDGFSELPTQPIIDWCQRLGYQVYLPVVGTLGNSDKRLRFSPIYRTHLRTVRTYNHALGMQQHRHNIKLWAHELDVIFCPLVAVDNTGTRIGMGGGYYDRTLAYTHKHRLTRPLTLGWCYDFQYVTCTRTQLLQRQPWDVPLDGVITPSTLMWFDTSAKMVPSALSSADAVNEHLKKLSISRSDSINHINQTIINGDTDLRADSNNNDDDVIDDNESNLKSLPMAEMDLTGIVNDKRLQELLNNCDDFLQTYGNLHDEFH